MFWKFIQNIPMLKYVYVMLLNIMIFKRSTWFICILLENQRKINEAEAVTKKSKFQIILVIVQFTVACQTLSERGRKNCLKLYLLRYITMNAIKVTIKYWYWRKYVHCVIDFSEIYIATKFISAKKKSVCWKKFQI